MDKNSFIGLLLIGAILLGWMYWSAPTKEELEKRRKQQDSITAIEIKKNSYNKKIVPQANANAVIKQSDTVAVISDSLKEAIQKNNYGPFYEASQGENKIYTLENELIKLTLSAKGGRIASVELKKYKTHNGKPLILFTADSSLFSASFVAQSRGFSTDSLYFTPEGKSDSVSNGGSSSFAMRLYAGDKSKYLEYVYSLKGNSYIVGVKLNTVGMQDVIASNTSDIALTWAMKTPSQEKSAETERHNSTLYYKYTDDEVDYLSETKDETKALDSKVKWIGFKQQFFTSAIIADNAFEKPIDIASVGVKNSLTSVKDFSASLTVPYMHEAHESFGFSFYFGPNHYKTLKQYNLQLEKQIPLGWGIFGWVNRFIVIPIFNFLDGFNINYGIIILILTILIKVLLFPIAYKTYISSAKMRILKPEIDEINKKFGTDDPMKKQQATMTLYRKAGINPLAGCVPMLLQMPILIALFRFFPSSIELRQKSFLWAEDLSSYDSILNLSFNIPFYGDHVSLFALLMTLSTLLYTYSNSQMMASTEQMPGMKTMMYLMPIVFLGVFNSNSSGLSYYYFLANLITFGQTYLIKSFIDEKALYRKIEENKKKPVKVSSFQQRLEKMAKERQQMAKKK